MVCYTDLGLAAVIARNSVGSERVLGRVERAGPPAAGRVATGMPALHGLDVDVGRRLRTPRASAPIAGAIKLDAARPSARNLVDGARSARARGSGRTWVMSHQIASVIPRPSAAILGGSATPKTK